MPTTPAPPGTPVPPTTAAPPGTPVPPTTPAPPGRPVPTGRESGTGTPIRRARGLTKEQRAGARTAAENTRKGWRAVGAGRPATGAHPTVRGLIWLFVWLGVLFYAIAHPAAVPKLFNLVFAPVNGVLAVARGTRTSVPQRAGV